MAPTGTNTNGSMANSPPNTSVNISHRLDPKSPNILSSRSTLTRSLKNDRGAIDHALSNHPSSRSSLTNTLAYTLNRRARSWPGQVELTGQSHGQTNRAKGEMHMATTTPWHWREEDPVPGGRSGLLLPAPGYKTTGCNGGD
jgi:hypothetical protein